MIQAEAYLEQLGTGLEATTDEGAAKTWGTSIQGITSDTKLRWSLPDPMSCRSGRLLNRPTAGCPCRLVDSEGNIHALGEFEFAATGGWQAWSTARFDVDLPVQGIGLLQLSVLDARSI